MMMIQYVTGEAMISSSKRQRGGEEGPYYH